MLTKKSKSGFILFLLLLCRFHPAHTQETLNSLEAEIRRLIDYNKASVVTIASGFSREVSSETERGILSFFKNEAPKKSLSYLNVGSGVIFDASGHILTRCSIACGSKSNLVTFSDGREAKASFVGHDPETGFAIIKVDIENLQPARFGDSDKVGPGAWNLMIGNSLGVYPSVVFGATNGLRSDGLIQVSANLNPGNNGSPVFNTEGEVIGLVAGQMDPLDSVTQPFFRGSFNSTIVAYPSNWIKKIASDIIQYGYVRRGWLGVVGYPGSWKPKIKEIKKNSPAQEAGLSKGDVIVKYAYREVSSISELVRLVKYTSPGETVPLEYVRDGKPMLADVRIGEKSHKETADPGIMGQASGARGSLTRTQRDQWMLMKIGELENELSRLRKMLEK
ncbi:MAG: S1C family serine protease [bacterium]